MELKKPAKAIRALTQRAATPKLKKAVFAGLGQDKKTDSKNSALASANAALQKSNTRLELSNKKITRKGIKEKASLSRSIQSGKDLTLKLAQSVERGSKNAKTAKAKLDRHIESGKDLTLKLAQSVERGSKNARTAKAKLNRKDAELILLNKELLTFTYISSHDLQEPLRNLQVIASLILEKEEQNLSAQGKDYFKRMQNAAMRIQKLIQDLIEYSNTNKVHFTSEPTDLNKLLRAVKADLKETLVESKTKISFKKLHTLMVSPFQFHKLFTELITNSIKFSKEGFAPKINITSNIVKGSIAGVKKFAVHKKHCHIAFTDNGLGFDRLFRERIFEVFQKLHGRQYKGSGIGLATCRKIVEHHGGIITATGEPGKGSTFNIYIPFH